MELSAIDFNDAVFINCPFDNEYTPLLHALVFTVYRCGFLPVTALGEDNGLDNRLFKIERCIEACRYGIHDISRTELNANDLPRFNMPFELGIFFGAKYFGDKNQRNKNAIIFDRDRYRYLEYISDINGVDIKAHNNDVNTIIRKIRDWLATASRRKTIPGHLVIQRQFAEFVEALPVVTGGLGLDSTNISFSDLCLIIEEAVRKFIE